jgi:pimeloyl-[acyl-carrier protein] methyl ester esterase
MQIETLGDGPDLVMLHGWAMHAGIFAPLTRALAPHFRLHLVDLPGHGASRDDTTSLDPATLARTLAGRLPRAIWLGWSLGGLVAMRAALDEPKSVRGLVLIASTPRFVTGEDWPHALDEETLSAFGTNLAHDYRATIERFLALESLGSDDARRELRDLKAAVFARGEPRVAALEEGMRVLETIDFRADVAQFRVPSLWIAGRRDRLVDAAAMRWSADASGGTFVEFDSGHVPFLAHADAMRDAIVAFAETLAP